MDTAHHYVPPVARRPTAGPAAALKEELADSCWLLFGCIGATGAVSALLFVLATLVG